MQIFIWPSLPPPPLQPSERLASNRWKKNIVVMLILQPGRAGQHHTLRFTLPSNRANSTYPLAMLPSMAPSVVGGNTLSPSSVPCFLIFSDHFNMVISSLASREGSNIPFPHFCCVHWLEDTLCAGARHLGGVSNHELRTHVHCTQRNDVEIDAGRLVPATMDE